MPRDVERPTWFLTGDESLEEQLAKRAERLAELRRPGPTLRVDRAGLPDFLRDLAPRQAPRSPRGARATRRATRRAPSRDGPSGSEDPEPLTALQRAQAAFLAALEAAQADPRTHRVFCDIATRRLAHEYARHLGDPA